MSKCEDEEEAGEPRNQGQGKTCCHTKNDASWFVPTVNTILPRKFTKATIASLIEKSCIVGRRMSIPATEFLSPCSCATVCAKRRREEHQDSGTPCRDECQTNCVKDTAAPYAATSHLMPLASILKWRTLTPLSRLPFCTLRPHALRTYGGDEAFPLPLLGVAGGAPATCKTSDKKEDEVADASVTKGVECSAASEVLASASDKMQPSFQHRYDKTGEDSARGLAAEQTFLELARRHGFELFKAPRHVDAKYHVDFLAVDKSALQASHAKLAGAFRAKVDAGKTHASAKSAFLLATIDAPAVDALRIDVKALKPLEKYGELQNTEMWLELHGTREHDRGWLLEGRADVVAVHVWDEPGHAAFVLLDRARLAHFALQKAATKARAHSASDALYKHYMRRDHEDIMRVLLQDAYEAAGCGVWCESESESKSESESTHD